ncbi:division inhibitor protein [compost metagenome]
MNHSLKENTRERILLATAELMKQKGYKAVTTKAIATEAKLNESTIFRQFGSKKNILDALIERFSYYQGIKEIYEHQLTWNLYEDLAAFTIEYQRFMKENGEFILIGLKEAGEYPELDERVSEVPKHTKEILMKYLSTMAEKGCIPYQDFEAAAMSFIWMNLGFFLSTSLYGDAISQVSMQNFLKTSIRIFASGLRGDITP